MRRRRAAIGSPGRDTPGSGATTPAAEVLVNADDAPGAPTELVERAVRAALATSPDTVGELSLTQLDDDGMRRLNAKYLHRDRATDVIAFTPGEAPILGDVYVGHERARAQAEEHGIGLEEELARLAIHGTLHLLGHDHPDGPERLQSPMFELQERLVREVMDRP